MAAMVKFALLLVVLTSVEAFGPPGDPIKKFFEGKKPFDKKPDKHEKPEESLLDQLSAPLQQLLPAPLKSLLEKIPFDEVKELKQILPKFADITSLKELEELVEKKAPTLLDLAKELFQKAELALKLKKEKLSPEALNFFAQLLGINKEALKQSLKLILGLEPKVKDNLKLVFPEVADLLKTPAAQKTIPLIINGTLA
ncbi:unnamed protein product [Bursaphelenchus okinawaensis]|uniref:Fatty-acid and retinol-binding protein 1 n=1 Tax=Bursaphelenchus okinawaensis TaxID=465554 RepID=A0A811KFQ7_9BILA|nr:unnamed protein product [Bursaphelenchus okinawaensis]CAG9102189.1 unnamed protein product [Bursaphelenchus okinawaensis]